MSENGTTLQRLQVIIEAVTKPFRTEMARARRIGAEATSEMNRQAEAMLRGYEGVAGGVRDATAAAGGFRDTMNSINDSNAGNDFGNEGGDAARNNFFRTLTASAREYAREAKLAAGVTVFTDEYRDAVSGYEKANAQLERLTRNKEILRSVGNTETVASDEYKMVASDIETTERKLASLQARQERFMDTGGSRRSNAYQRMQYDIDELSNALEHYRSELAEMDANGTGSVTRTTAEWNRNEEAIRRAAAEIEYYQRQMDGLSASGRDTQYATSAAGNGSYAQAAVASAQQAAAGVRSAMSSARASVTSFIQGIPVIGRAFRESAYIASAAFKGLKAVLNGVGAVVKKTSGLFGALIKKLKDTASGGNRASRSLRGTNGAANKLCGGIFKLGNMFKLLVIRMALKAVIAGIKSGFENLAQYSDRTNQSLSLLKSSLTQLKNSFATAFAPILNVVAPILATLIGYISQALTAIGQLFAALTGQKTFVTATKVNEDYAASLANSSGAAKDAADATEKYRNAIMGFDQINKRDSKTDSDSGSGSAGTVAIDDMFETVEIGSRFADLAEKIKEAWRLADFTEIGEMIGNKLNQALFGINWDKIQSTLDKIAKSTATFLNGFIGATDWALVGGTLSQGINTAFRTANTFATTFDWGSLGNAVSGGVNGALNALDWEAIKTSINNIVSGITGTLNTIIQNMDWGLIGKSFAEKINTILGGLYTFVTEFDWSGLGSALSSSINGWITTVDWAKTGKTLSDGIKGILSFIKTALAEINWYEIGKAVSDFLANIDWAGIIRDLAFIIGQAIGGLANLLWGFIEDCVKSIGDFFSARIEECGGNIVFGLLKGIADAVVGIFSWLWDNLVQPIIDGIKSMLGIHSPSTVFAEIGGFIIQGLINGIAAFVQGVIDLFTAIWEKIVEIFSEVGTWFGEKFTSAKESVCAAFASIGEWFSGKWTAIKEVFASVGTWFGEKFTAAVDGVKGAFKSVGDFFKGIWEGIKSTFSSVATWFGSIFSKAWEAVKKVFSVGGKIFDGIKDGILSALKTVINAIIDGLNKVIALPFNGINSALDKLRSLSLPLIGAPFGWLPSIGVPQIPKLARGGVVGTGQLFVANEAGPELVGSFGGQSGVMNNNQIVDSVSRGVYDAVAAALMNSKGSEAPTIELTILADSETLYKIVEKGRKSSDRRYKVVKQL